MGCGASTPENAVAPAPVKPAAVAPAPAPHQDRAPKVASTPPSAKAPASTASPVPPVASATSTPSPSKLRQPSALPLNKDDATKRLLQAAQSGDADRCQRALAADAQVSGTDDHGCTALHYAAGKSHLMVVNLLIKAGAPLEARDGEHCTPLLRAARDAEGPSGAEVVRRLIAAGAKAAAVDKAGNGLVHMAAQGANNASVLTALLEAKANVMAKNSAGETPLHCAGRQSEDFIRALRDAGADVNAVAGPSKSTPLHSAAERGEVSAIRALLRAGANVNAANASGDTPLMVAARAGRVELMDALLKGGASVEATNKAQDTALHAAVDAGRHVVRCLLDAKAPINAANGKGLTALHLAAATANDKVAELLLKLGASAALNLPDGAGNTPLWHAVAYRPHPGWRTMVDLLVESGADAEHACMGEKTEVVSQLRAGMLMAD